MKDFRLKGKIIERFGTQSDFAVKVGRSEPEVSRFVCRRSLPLSDQKKWAKILKCKVTDIF